MLDALSAAVAKDPAEFECNGGCNLFRREFRYQLPGDFEQVRVAVVREEQHRIDGSVYVRNFERLNRFAQLVAKIAGGLEHACLKPRVLRRVLSVPCGIGEPLAEAIAVPELLVCLA